MRQVEGELIGDEEEGGSRKWVNIAEGIIRWEFHYYTGTGKEVVVFFGEKMISQFILPTPYRKRSTNLQQKQKLTTTKTIARSSNSEAPPELRRVSAHPYQRSSVLKQH